MKEMRPETGLGSVTKREEGAHERQGNNRQYRIERSPSEERK
jgi:hypothetical protein